MAEKKPDSSVPTPVPVSDRWSLSEGTMDCSGLTFGAL